MQQNEIKQTHDVKHLSHFSGFDYLRVASVLAVVAWHTKALGSTSLVTHQLNLNLKEIVYANIFLIAVPLFAQISVFLYLFNHQAKQNYFIKRTGYLLTLYLFWFTLILILFYGSGDGWKLKTYEFWLSGANTPLYFILVITVLAIITEVFLILKKFVSERIFISLSIFCLLISFSALVLKEYLFGSVNPQILPIFMSHWSFFNFIPYIFAAFIFQFLYQKDLLNAKIIKTGFLVILAVIIIAAIFEYKILPSQAYFRFDGMLIPPYSRLSIILSTLLIFYIFLNKNFAVPAIIKKFSEYSLGIYIMHIFVMNLFPGHFAGIYKQIQHSMVYFLIVVVISFIATYILKQRKLV